MLSVRQVRSRGGSLRQPMKNTLGDASLSLARYLSINTKKEQFAGLNFWKPQNIEETTALSLSGGGSKGSFQVGTLHFFHQSGLWSKLKITRIASSSVGSVNALKLAEDDPQNIPEMLKIWMDLKSPNNMFGKSKFYNLLLGKIDSWWGSIIWDEVFTDKTIAAFIGDFVRGGSIFELEPTRHILAKNVNFNKVKNSNIDLRLVASEQRTQRPVAFTKFNTLIRPRNETEPFPHTNWKLYETVELESVGEETDFDERMLNAVLASAAIPGAFPVVTALEISQDKTLPGFYVDGGVNDILPRRFAGSLNGVLSPLSREPVHFLSIFAGAVGVENEAAPIEEIEAYRRRHFLDIKGTDDTLINFPLIRPSWRWKEGKRRPNIIENIARGLFSALSEVSRGDIVEGQIAEGEETLIQPFQAVHGTLEMNPGKLRINAAYGYMSAFDKMLIAGGDLSAQQEKLLLKTSYQITRLRVLAIKRQELSIERFVSFFLADSFEDGPHNDVDTFLNYVDENPHSNLSLKDKFAKAKMDLDVSNIDDLRTEKMLFNEKTLKRLREDKKEIATQVIIRVQNFGLGSVPTNMDSSQNLERKSHNSVASWWTNFELSNRNKWFLHTQLSDRQSVGTTGKLANLTIRSREKNDSFNIAPRNLPSDIINALS